MDKRQLKNFVIVNQKNVYGQFYTTEVQAVITGKFNLKDDKEELFNLMRIDNFEMFIVTDLETDNNRLQIVFVAL